MTLAVKPSMANELEASEVAAVVAKLSGPKGLMPIRLMIVLLTL